MLSNLQWYYCWFGFYFWPDRKYIWLLGWHVRKRREADPKRHANEKCKWNFHARHHVGSKCRYNENRKTGKQNLDLVSEWLNEPTTPTRCKFMNILVFMALWGEYLTDWRILRSIGRDPHNRWQKWNCFFTTQNSGRSNWGWAGT